MEELELLPNVFQLPTDLKGNWKKQVFKNDGEIVLELACGKGEYSLAMANCFPGKNFIGMDIKGSRLWRGAKEAAEMQLNNVAFLRAYIDHIETYFSPAEVAEIWITFPDPYLPKSKAKKRLTSPAFLLRYQNILKPHGIIHLKTDEEQLYEFTLQTIQELKWKLIKHTADLDMAPRENSLLQIKTFYEMQHLAAGKTIKYIQFQVP